MNHELSHSIGLQGEEIVKKGKMRQEMKELLSKIRRLRHTLSTKRRKLTRAFEGTNPKGWNKMKNRVKRVKLGEGSRGILRDIAAQKQLREQRLKNARRKQAELELAIAECSDKKCVVTAKLKAAREKRTELKGQNDELVKTLDRATGIANEDVGATVLSLKDSYAKMRADEALLDSELANQVKLNKQDAKMQYRLKIEAEKQALLDSAPPV